MGFTRTAGLPFGFGFAFDFADFADPTRVPGVRLRLCLPVLRGGLCGGPSVCDCAWTRSQGGML